MPRRPEPKSFAERGLARTLAVQVPQQLRDKLIGEIRHASPLELSRGAVRTLEKVSEIYVRRGFVEVKQAELCEFREEGADVNDPWAAYDARGDARTPPSGGSGGSAQANDPWVLEYVDSAEDGVWDTAAFLVNTAAGRWRVLVVRRAHSHPMVTAVIPTVGSERQGPQSQSLPERPRPALHVTPGSPEWKRLEMLGCSLLDTHMALSLFLTTKCPKVSQSSVWDSCLELQKACGEELPDLRTALEWKSGETWEAWAHRASEHLNKACSCQELRIPVRSLHFTQYSICRKFRQGEGAGRDLEALVEDLRKGHVDPLTHDDLLLEAVCYHGKLYCLNNRRLWALQQHQLMLISDDVEVEVRVNVLPWSSGSRTLKRFSTYFDTQTDGKEIICRTAQDGAPTDGVVATTLVRAVLATPKALRAEQLREQEMLERRAGGTTTGGDGPQGVTGRSDGAVAPWSFGAGSLRLGDEYFADWRSAKERCQQIMQQRTGGRPVAAAELRLLLDVFAFHAGAQEKRIAEVTSVTVGSSEKYPGTPSFWIWRRDGTGEDISINLCWKRFDLVEKTRRKNNEKRDILAAGRRYSGTLQTWSFETKPVFGLVVLDEDVDHTGTVFIGRHQQVYLEWVDIAPPSQARAARPPAWPFNRGTRFSFVVYREKEGGRYGCTDAELV